MKKFLALSLNTNDERHLIYNNIVIEKWEPSVHRFDIINDIVRRYTSLAKNIGQPYIPIIVDGKQDGGIAID